ncbi:uncharacterized protein LOC143024609 [Oratosquilla oratoria]|uniref:uncharacterized protein LOC143024609 n=1 Tax=Oratosquilla oratoria TaxID=337810 RepID=UPI003F772B28
MGLLPLHSGSSEGSIPYRQIMLGLAAGFMVPVLLPFLHFGIISHLWDEYNFKVDPRTCSCSCWDTIFKGVYERGPAGFKHIYFNVTSNTFKIWIVTVLAVILTYEATKRVVHLLLARELRWSMLVLLGCSVYPHYYSWWSYFNYWNDEFYHHWNHQLFFSITEMISTIAVVYLMDKSVAITSGRILIIVNIAILHVLSAGFDQFIENVVRGNGMLHQVLRDIFFMIPDMMLITVPLFELGRLAKAHQVPAAYLVSNREFLASVAFIFLGWLVCMIL